MSTSNCGCGSSATPQPGNQIIVPPGTHIVQQPCAAVPAQYAAVAANAFNSGTASGPSQGEAGACAAFAHPSVKRSFVAAPTGQTGSFLSECAGYWGLPGVILYFPGHGQLEVVGASASSVTYRNRTVAPGVEILEGTQFAVGIPVPPVEIVDTGDSETPSVPAEVVYEDATQLSNIRGVLNNVPSRVVPIDNHVFIGRSGTWQRRAAGQWRYPAGAVNLLATTQTAQNQTWNINLPSKPTLPVEATTFGVEINASLVVIPSEELNGMLTMQLNIGSYPLMACSSDHRRNENSSMYIANLAASATQLTVSTAKTGNFTGQMVLSISLHAYHY